MGDFNYPNIDREIPRANSDCAGFLDLVMDYVLYQHVFFLTREENNLDLS